MFINPLIEKLEQLRLSGMAKALTEQLQQADIHQLSFKERLGLMIELEQAVRDHRRLQTLLNKAKFKLSNACVEDIDYQATRKIDRNLIRKLSQCDWVRAHHNILITGATGTGKTFLACALAHKGCLEKLSARYYRCPRLFSELAISKADGRYLKLLRQFEKTDILILDDWGIGNLTHEQRKDLLELFDDRHGHRSTIITSQLPIKLWHDYIGDKTLADAIMDRVIHNAYRLELSGESMRKMILSNTEKSLEPV